MSARCSLGSALYNRGYSLAASVSVTPLRLGHSMSGLLNIAANRSRRSDVSLWPTAAGRQTRREGQVLAES